MQPQYGRGDQRSAENRDDDDVASAHRRGAHFGPSGAAVARARRSRSKRQSQPTAVTPARATRTKNVTVDVRLLASARDRAARRSAAKRQSSEYGASAKPA